MNSFILFVSKWGKCHSLSLLKEKIILLLFFFFFSSYRPSKQTTKQRKGLSEVSVLVQIVQINQSILEMEKSTVASAQHYALLFTSPVHMLHLHYSKDTVLPIPKLCCMEKQAYLVKPQYPYTASSCSVQTNH